MLTALRYAWPYLFAAAVGASLGIGAEHMIADAQLGAEKAARARDNEQHARDMKAVSDAALVAEQKAIARGKVAAGKIETLDAQLTKERNAHETDNRSYRAALAAGTERVRVAVRNCSATGSDGLPGSAGAAGVGDGATAQADLDPAVAERVFGVAGDDDREIDKLKAMQGWACAVRPATAGCQ